MTNKKSESISTSNSICQSQKAPSLFSYTSAKVLKLDTYTTQPLQQSLSRYRHLECKVLPPAGFTMLIPTTFGSSIISSLLVVVIRISRLNKGRVGKHTAKVHYEGQTQAGWLKFCSPSTSSKRLVSSQLSARHDTIEGKRAPNYPSSEREDNTRRLVCSI